MAFEMAFTDEFGDTYTESYWKVAQTNISQAEKRGQIRFHGFENEAKKDKRIIGVKDYTIDEDTYETYFAADALNPDGKNPAAAAYIYAKAKKDVPVEDGEPISFFENALDV